MYPGYLIENEAKAASVPIRPTVDDYDVQVGSTRPDFHWEDAIGECAEGYAWEAKARPVTQPHAQPHAQPDARWSRELFTFWL